MQSPCATETGRPHARHIAAPTEDHVVGTDARFRRDGALRHAVRSLTVAEVDAVCVTCDGPARFCDCRVSA